MNQKRAEKKKHEHPNRPISYDPIKWTNENESSLHLQKVLQNPKRSENLPNKDGLLNERFKSGNTQEHHSYYSCYVLICSKSVYL